MVTKVNVSLPDELLKKLDEVARAAGKSRSSILSEAALHFIEEKENEDRRARRLEAAAAMDRFREKFGDWDGTAEVLKWRELH